ncbi:beta-glucuronosyltransferase GlcAT14A-like [Apium graveolens]|uniref:beta-glucuronosyltransferase GlcAT14A-like n=1 Tax=Apium graveolens TaxID=4045 RepID=UPI003D7A268F
MSPFTRVRKIGHFNSGSIFRDRKWIKPFLASSFILITLFTSVGVLMFSSSFVWDPHQFDIASFTRSDTSGYFVESDLNRLSEISSVLKTEAPRFAYLISGTNGDGQRMMRTLQAVYHPRNQYILHLDLEALPREMLDLTMSVKNDPLFREIDNVYVMEKSNMVTYRGPTMIATTLQAIAILLKKSASWDWFINLSASDYPLMTQDDMLHVFSNMSRNLNFIEHTKIRGWKLNRRAKPIIVDPGLYLSKKSGIFWTTQRRSVPTSFKLFTGSAWAILSRSFVEYCIWGWNSLPRTILMYYTNFISSPEGYFHTVICNTEAYRHTAISHDLHYIAWDSPPKQHPKSLTIKDFDNMVNSSAPFARKFDKDDPVLDKIDKELLGRNNRFAPGSWCIGSSEGGVDPCSSVGDDSVFKPGPGSERLKVLIKKLLSREFREKQCKL